VRREAGAGRRLAGKEAMTHVDRAYALVLILFLALGLMAAGCQQQEPYQEPRPTRAEPPAPEPVAEEPRDIVDTAVAAGQFGTLVQAVQAAGLVETLKGEGPFTVFAPTDEAFGKLPPGTLEDLLKPENKEQLTAILTYHVVPSKAMAADVVDMTSATTVNGKDLAIKVEDGTVMVDGAKVVQADIECSNGVIHVIDGVVLP
jgi:transforming growth factor-beta-induced protein